MNYPEETSAKMDRIIEKMFSSVSLEDIHEVINSKDSNKEDFIRTIEDELSLRIRSYEKKYHIFQKTLYN